MESELSGANEATETNVGTRPPQHQKTSCPKSTKERKKSELNAVLNELREELSIHLRTAIPNKKQEILDLALLQLRKLSLELQWPHYMAQSESLVCDVELEELLRRDIEEAKDDSTLSRLATDLCTEDEESRLPGTTPTEAGILCERAEAASSTVTSAGESASSVENENHVGYQPDDSDISCSNFEKQVGRLDSKQEACVRILLCLLKTLVAVNVGTYAFQALISNLDESTLSKYEFITEKILSPDPSMRQCKIIPLFWFFLARTDISSAGLQRYRTPAIMVVRAILLTRPIFAYISTSLYQVGVCSISLGPCYIPQDAAVFWTYGPAASAPAYTICTTRWFCVLYFVVVMVDSKVERIALWFWATVWWAMAHSKSVVPNGQVSLFDFIAKLGMLAVILNTVVDGHLRNVLHAVAQRYCLVIPALLIFHLSRILSAGPCSHPTLHNYR